MSTDDQEADLERLRADLGAPEPAVRLESAYSLAKRGDFSGREVFLEALRDPEPSTRLSAANRLGAIGAPWAVGPVADLLRDEESYVRNEAIFALANIGVPSAVPPLIGALEDEDPERREDARSALVLLLGDDVPTAADETEEIEGEADRVADWWRERSASFRPGLHYDRGEPVSIGAWIEGLDGARPSRRRWIATRLENWTGLNLAEPDAPDFARRWQAWWHDHAAEYSPGRRFFHGVSVDDLAA
jgi:hypothetical protein